MKVAEIEAKTLIQRSKIPSISYVINPYTGCALACAYCYASFSGRLVGEPVKEWGNYVYVKKNAVELARKELGKMPEHKRQGTLLLSSVTDPYQGPERKYRLRRGILEALVEIRYPGMMNSRRWRTRQRFPTLRLKLSHLMLNNNDQPTSRRLMISLLLAAAAP